MSEEKIRVKCPVCGGVLKVKNTSELDKKSLKCPICSSVSKFCAFEHLSQQTTQSEETDYYKKEELQPDNIGLLRHTATGKIYPLMTGNNTIGRMASTSLAQIQIETDDFYMSRNHAEILVTRNKSGAFLHFFKNAKNKNSTYVNGQIVTEGDSLMLEGGEIIRMGHTELRFERLHNIQTSSTEEGGTEY